MILDCGSEIAMNRPAGVADEEIRLVTGDDRLKLLGQLLANESSRRIIVALSEKEMYVNEISTQLGISSSLVTHHLSNMKRLGLVDVVARPIRRGQKEHNFYSINKSLLIIPGKRSEEIEQNNIPGRILRDGVKYSFLALGGAFLLSVYSKLWPSDPGFQFSEDSSMFSKLLDSETSVIAMVLVALGIILVVKKIKNGS